MQFFSHPIPAVVRLCLVGMVLVNVIFPRGLSADDSAYEAPWLGEVHVDLGEESQAESEPPKIREASLQPQPSFAPTPQVAPPLQAPAAPSPFGAGSAGAPQLGPTSVRSASGLRSTTIGVSRTTNQQALLRASTDAGNLLGKSPSVLGIGTQRRSSVITDTRIRGDRVGALAASGSYWVPARLDMDTALSKIDSYNVDTLDVIKGPYAALEGPGRNFIAFELLPAPRFDDGLHSEGVTGLTYQTNGQQWHGRQTFAVGDRKWGARVDYHHRTGSDYTAGDGALIPSSYKSRELLTSLGYTFDDDSRLDFHYLRLDQTDVELPGQAMDINFLVTDGFELTYIDADPSWADARELEAWYNRTRFEGDNFRASKRRQFPIYDFFDFFARTDVDSASSGVSLANVWGDEACWQLRLGADLRYVKQELNEISSGRIGFIPFFDANSPVPRSDWVNPGVFAELRAPLSEAWEVTSGARLDYVQTDVLADPADLEMLGTQVPQASLADILGTDQFEQRFHLLLAYLTCEYHLTDQATLQAALGHGERAPNLTELYAAQPFMFLLQNGLNIVTGDPRLNEEKLWQVDVGASYENGGLRLQANAFHAWIHDFITFENVRTTADQIDLKYVNTDLATLTGVELSGEYDWSDWLTPFATLQYVEGRDHTRNGEFATRPNMPGTPSERVPDLPRGFFSGIVGGASEPLPGIPPLESRLGLRFHEPGDAPRYSLEVAARVADNQDRVATSLRETPTPGFTVWDVRGQAHPYEFLTLVAGVENLFDRTYREHLDLRPLATSFAALPVLRPGINFYFGSELRY